MIAAVSGTKTERNRADRARIGRRDHRSMNRPANGPISEYGRYTAVKAAAPFAGLVNVVALKNTYVPTPAVKTPSPVCEISRVDSSRRKSRPASTTRRSETKADRVIQLITAPSAHPAGTLSRPQPSPVRRPAWRGTHPAYGAAGPAAGLACWTEGWPQRAIMAGRSGQPSTSPRVNLATTSRAAASPYCSVGDFLMY